MIIAAAITQKLTDALAPIHLDVRNESHMHNVPENSETHFKVVIVSETFAEQSRVVRHQSIYRILADELAGPVHALSVHAYTTAEWAQIDAAPTSPTCRGGMTFENDTK